MEHKCILCEYWNNGNCQRKSPVVIEDGYEVGACGHLTVFPETNPDDFCGDFYPKSETKEKP